MLEFRKSLLNLEQEFVEYEIPRTYKGLGGKNFTMSLIRKKKRPTKTANIRTFCITRIVPTFLKKGTRLSLFEKLLWRPFCRIICSTSFY
jgi:hypothetical protein